MWIKNSPTVFTSHRTLCFPSVERDVLGPDATLHRSRCWTLGHCARPFRATSMCCLGPSAHYVLPSTAVSNSFSLLFIFLPSKNVALVSVNIHMFFFSFFYQCIKMPLTPFISTAMELTMTRVCRMNSKVFENFFGNEKSKKQNIFPVLLLLCVLEIPQRASLKVSRHSLWSSVTFYINKMEIWHLEK